MFDSRTDCIVFSAKYGQADPERAQEKIEGVDAGRDISSEEGSSSGNHNLSGGQIGAGQTGGGQLGGGQLGGVYPKVTKQS